MTAVQISAEMQVRNTLANIPTSMKTGRHPLDTLKMLTKVGMLEEARAWYATETSIRPIHMFLSLIRAEYVKEALEFAIGDVGEEVKKMAQAVYAGTFKNPDGSIVQVPASMQRKSKVAPTSKVVEIKTGKSIYLDMPGFMQLVAERNYADAISRGIVSDLSQVVSAAEKLRAGEWFRKDTGERIPAVPGFGPATLPELNRIIPLLGEDEAYKWAMQYVDERGEDGTPHLFRHICYFWREGKFRLFDGTILPPPSGFGPVETKTAKSGGLAAAKARKKERSLRDQKAYLEKIGGKKKKKD